MNRQKVHAYFKGSGRLMIAEHGDALWATDSFLMVRLEDGSPVAALLDYWNLPLEPGVFFVEQNVRKGTGEPPDVASLIAKMVVGKKMERHEVVAKPSYVIINSEWASVWELPHSSLVTVSKAKQEMVEDLTTTTGDWFGSNPEKPLAYMVEKEAVGYLMPLRHG